MIIFYIVKVANSVAVAVACNGNHGRRATGQALDRPRPSEQFRQMEKRDANLGPNSTKTTASVKVKKRATMTMFATFLFY